MCIQEPFLGLQYTDGFKNEFGLKNTLKIIPAIDACTCTPLTYMRNININ